jgi:hypothetical protein
MITCYRMIMPLAGGMAFAEDTRCVVSLERSFMRPMFE